MKLMANMRKRIKIMIRTNEKTFLNMLQDLHTLDIKNVVVIHEKKEYLTLNKPIYVENTVLELSKLAMYKFYYGFVKRKM